MHRSSLNKPKSILIVDDNGINRLLPGLILRPFGWTVYEAAGGLDALRTIKNAEISCVLLDISMPDISGLEVLKALRKKPELQNIKIFAYTGYAQKKDVTYLLSLGFDAVLFKPLTSIKLLTLLQTA
jgi:two-component system phosphate regulon response regulator PhoB